MTVSADTKVCVCVCTYKRPALLKRCLDELAKQQTYGRFVFSVVVADNDAEQSSRETVCQFQAASSIETVYCVEPQQNIAMARNRAIKNASGDFIAFIDDDEFPAANWLAALLRTCQEHGADGVLGPVRPHFDKPPPQWLVRGGFCERPEHPTGTCLDWRQTRTGNVIFKKAILDGTSEPFHRDFGNGGEDTDFFRRMMEKGRRFIWCNEAAVFEVVPPERWKRTYLLKRALLRGQNERLFLSASSIAKSIVAAPIYAVALPLLLLMGQHRFMGALVKLADHGGKLLAAFRLRLVRSRCMAA